MQTPHPLPPRATAGVGRAAQGHHHTAASPQSWEERGANPSKGLLVYQLAQKALQSCILSPTGILRGLGGLNNSLFLTSHTGSGEEPLVTQCCPDRRVRRPGVGQGRSSLGECVLGPGRAQVSLQCVCVCVWWMPFQSWRERDRVKGRNPTSFLDMDRCAQRFPQVTAQGFPQVKRAQGHKSRARTATGTSSLDGSRLALSYPWG